MKDEWYKKLDVVHTIALGGLFVVVACRVSATISTDEINFVMGK